MSLSRRLKEAGSRLDRAAELQTEFSRLQMLANQAPSIISYRKANTAAIELSAHITGILAHLINGHQATIAYDGNRDNVGKVVPFPFVELGDPRDPNAIPPAPLVS